MSYRNLIDKALEAAQARAHTPVETAKIASAPDALIKEAMDVAGALEFVSLSATGGDRAAGFREEMIREFYKTASSGNPANGPTAASGTQGIAPAAGKTKLAPKGLVGGNAPAQSTVSAATKDGDKAMLESFKQAGGQSLYDILMGNKTAAAGGPAEHDSETSAGVGTSNENSTYRKTLHSNEGPVNANRRDLKKSTRARLAEAFAHTGDTLGDATAAQIFPQAAARGSLKIASVLRKEAAEDSERDIFQVFGNRPVSPRSYKKMMRTALKSHGMSGQRRMEMARESLEGRGKDERRTAYSTLKGTVAGTLAGGAISSLLGGSKGKSALVGTATGLLSGGASGLRSEANRLNAAKASKNPSAVMAELAPTRTKRRVRDEAKTLAKVVAARSGRKVQGNPLIRIDRADGNKGS